MMIDAGWHVPCTVEYVVWKTPVRTGWEQPMLPLIAVAMTATATAKEQSRVTVIVIVA